MNIDYPIAHLLDMLQARRTDDHRIAVLPLEQAVVRHPAQRDLGERQPVLVRRPADERERVEVRLLPVPAAADQERTGV